jgi:hypothetical protein
MSDTQKPEPEPRIYRIRRYRVHGRPRTIHNNVTLTVAQLHCNDPRTRKAGVWFDGYDYMPGCAPERES